MEQDVNKIIDNLSSEWAQDMVNAKKRIAVLIEDKRLLEEKVKGLEDEVGVLNAVDEHVKGQQNNAPTDNAK